MARLERRAEISGFLCTLLAALFLPPSASAQDLDPDQGKPAASDWPLSWRLPASPTIGSASRWIVSVEATAFSRKGGVNQALISRAPADTPFFSQSGANTANTPGVEAFNSNQFQQGLSAGPKVGLIYLGDSGYGAELAFFSVPGLNAAKAIGPDGGWLVMQAPGSFWQTQDFSNQAMEWKSKTNLYGAEANGRLEYLKPGDRSRRFALAPTGRQSSGES